MLQNILAFLATIGWADLITDLLSGILPIIVTAVIAWAGKEYAQLKTTTKYGAALDTIQSMAAAFVRAAYAVGEAQGWDGPKRREYVFLRLKDVTEHLPVKFTDTQLNEIIDSIIESTYSTLKTYGEVGPLNATAELPPEDVLEAGMAEAGSYGTPAEEVAE